VRGFVESLKHIMLGLAIMPAILFLYILSVAALGPAVNDIRAHKIERGFLNLTLPPQTEMVETVTFCGNSSGRSNHTEIWGGFVVKSALSEAELARWAETITMPHLMLGYKVWSVPEDFEAQEPVLCYYVHFEHFNDATEAEGYYMISSYYSAVTQHDLRGH